jgi:hypothetical protein
MAKSIKYFLCLLLFTLLHFSLTADTQKKYIKTFDEIKKYHHFQLTDSAYKYNIVVLATKPEKLKTNHDKFYTWYINNTINTTQGNFSGKLFHGIFVKYFINSNQLAEKGSYEYGLRNGTWYRWQENGNLISAINYKKGTMHGKAYFYADGELSEVTKYKKGIEKTKKEKQDTAKTEKKVKEKPAKETKEKSAKQKDKKPKTTDKSTKVEKTSKENKSKKTETKTEKKAKTSPLKKKDKTDNKA